MNERTHNSFETYKNNKNSNSNNNDPNKNQNSEFAVEFDTKASAENKDQQSIDKK